MRRSLVFLTLVGVFVLGGYSPMGLMPTALAGPKKIVVALDTEIDTMELDAFKSDAAYVLDSNTQERPIDYVLKPGPQNTWDTGDDFEGVLSGSWEFSEDGKTLTFHIRKGITFYNGNPVDAKAFKHSY